VQKKAAGFCASAFLVGCAESRNELSLIASELPGNCMRAVRPALLRELTQRDSRASEYNFGHCISSDLEVLACENDILEYSFLLLSAHVHFSAITFGFSL
jgi:hypothetical protein